MTGARGSVRAHPIPILLYHSVAEDASDRFKRWTVTPRVFAEHVQYLADQGYAPVTLSALVNAMTRGGALPPQPVAITFDDGFADTHENALPCLSRAGFPATVYVVAGAIGGTSRWLHPEGEGDRRILSWSQLAELAAEGIECGAHGMTHHALDTMPIADARDEIADSKGVLEQGLSLPIESFAYPHGYYTGRLQTFVRQAGFSSAAGVKHALSSADDDAYAIARIIVSRDTDVETLGRWLSGDGLRVAPKRNALSTTAWRLARRVQQMVGGIQHVGARPGPGQPQR